MSSSPKSLSSSSLPIPIIIVGIPEMRLIILMNTHSPQGYRQGDSSYQFSLRNRWYGIWMAAGGNIDHHSLNLFLKPRGLPLDQLTLRSKQIQEGLMKQQNGGNFPCP